MLTGPFSRVRAERRAGTGSLIVAVASEHAFLPSWLRVTGRGQR